MKEHKVVYNESYGGFSLSDKALEWLLKNAREEVAVKVKDYLKDHTRCKYNKDWNHIDSIERHDSDLVRCVEKLGHAANGRCAKLNIKDLSGNTYRIEEYDGWESVIEPCDEKYIIIKEGEK